MPYVGTDRMRLLDGGSIPQDAGDLTFLLTRQIQRYLGRGALVPCPVNYAEIATVLGSIDGARIDFVNRVVTPYEARKQQSNGDVWPVELLMP